ncbi:MAG TPA: [LysW]-aminoadipate kinase [Caldilineae bacterium]|nr:[LysW]-aminoadipate kinase [Caldilineae bacterium]
MTQSTIVIKLGGGEGVNPEPLLQELPDLLARGHRVVLTHGASAAANALADQAGLDRRQLLSPSGHLSRYTYPAMLEIFVAAAAGQVNKTLVAALQARGVNAVGLSGVDGRLLVAERKRAIRAVENGRQRVIRDDYSGKIRESHPDVLHRLLDGGFTPVVAPLALGVKGERLNVDGDRAAATIAAALEADALVILSNVPGLLADFPDETSLIPRVTPQTLELARAAAQGRMKRKVLAAEEALAGGVGRAILADARVENPVASALAGAGTVFSR